VVFRTASRLSASGPGKGRFTPNATREMHTAFRFSPPSNLTTAPHCKLLFFQKSQWSQKIQWSFSSKVWQLMRKKFQHGRKLHLYLETDDNSTNWTWSAWDFERVKRGTQSDFTAMEAASKEWKNALNDRTSKKAELKANPVNILKERNFAATAQHQYCLKVWQIVLLHPLLYRHEICLSAWVEQRQWRLFNTSTFRHEILFLSSWSPMISSQYAKSFRTLLCNTVHAFSISSAVLRFTANGVLKTLKREDMIPKTFSSVFLAQ